MNLFKGSNDEETHFLMILEYLKKSVKRWTEQLATAKLEIIAVCFAMLLDNQQHFTKENLGQIYINPILKKMYSKTTALLSFATVLSFFLEGTLCNPNNRRISCDQSPIICECLEEENVSATRRMLKKTICAGYFRPENAGRACKTFCQSIGRIGGECMADNHDCICSTSRIPYFYRSLCVTDEVCSVFCKTYRGLSGGQCTGTGVIKECHCVSH
ncbi:unnamed protein product [Lepeophtheirus salmonis]|uniref:(salmon louse) hypothetical protein n=1 Tax=Lepeophtheirus salmonis TaxID=72036 RepID=A0A7R8H029_LEPSM|nr:unnamed protein product [Lepeophtheirus salmonis]CAF2761626.1 unnamed protein product [Lepeophtheirus salmonis]